MNRPIKQFNAGGIQAAVWENSGKEGKTYNTVTLQRSYKDKDEQWKHSSYLKTNDIPKAIVLLQKAYEKLGIKESNPSDN